MHVEAVQRSLHSPVIWNAQKTTEKFCSNWKLKPRWRYALKSRGWALWPKSLGENVCCLIIPFAFKSTTLRSDYCHFAFAIICARRTAKKSFKALTRALKIDLQRNRETEFTSKLLDSRPTFGGRTGLLSLARSPKTQLFYSHSTLVPITPFAQWTSVAGWLIRMRSPCERFAQW